MPMGEIRKIYDCDTGKSMHQFYKIESNIFFEKCRVCSCIKWYGSNETDIGTRQRYIKAQLGKKPVRCPICYREWLTDTRADASITCNKCNNGFMPKFSYMPESRLENEFPDFIVKRKAWSDRCLSLGGLKQGGFNCPVEILDRAYGYPASVLHDSYDLIPAGGKKPSLEEFDQSYKYTKETLSHVLGLAKRFTNHERKLDEMRLTMDTMQKAIITMHTIIASNGKNVSSDISADMIKTSAGQIKLTPSDSTVLIPKNEPIEGGSG